MSVSITVIMKVGPAKNFPHVERCGGSWVNSYRIEGSMTIIKDVWENEICIPTADIKEMQVNRH